LSPDESNTDSITISNTPGDVFGIGVSSLGDVIRKNIEVNSGTIFVDESKKVLNLANKYKKALEDLSHFIYEKLSGRQIPEDKVKSTNNDLTDLGKEVENVKPGKEEELIMLKNFM
jgi:hypothetical protein